MDYEKARLTPIDDVKDDKQEKTPAQIEARKQLERQRAQTQRYKQKYFELYDDVKINHREDW